jgi:hypothetical protein
MAFFVPQGLGQRTGEGFVFLRALLGFRQLGLPARGLVFFGLLDLVLRICSLDLGLRLGLFGGLALGLGSRGQNPILGWGSDLTPD